MLSWSEEHQVSIKPPKRPSSLEVRMAAVPLEISRTMRVCLNCLN